MKKAFSLIFLFLLLVPAVVWLIGLDLGPNAKSKKPNPPRPYGNALLSVDYYRSFDQYFNRNFSLRSPLTFAKNWLDYHVFRTTDATGVHIGRSGWLYSRKSIEDYRKEACREEEHVGRMFLELQALEKIIEASGRRLLFCVAPNKSTVYPEHVGFVPNNAGCGRTRYDVLLENMSEYPLRSFVRLDEELRKAKKPNTLLYDSTSSYWNRLGAMVASETIHRRTFDGYLMDPPVDSHSSGISSSGDLYGQLMGLASLTEDKPFQSFVNPHRPYLPTGLLYGDGFTLNLLPYVEGMFRQLDVATGDRVPSKQHGENLLAYDFILLERAESELDTLHMDLDKIFSSLEPKAHIPERYLLDLRAAVPVSHISLDLGNDGLQIKSMGSESTFELTSVPGSDESTFRVLKLTLAASHSNIMAVTCLTDIPYAATKPLKQGVTEIYLPQPFQKVVSLRIQPGTRAGLFVLRCVEVLGFTQDQSMQEPSPDNITPAKTDEETEAHSLAQGWTEGIFEPAPYADLSAAKADGPTSEFGSETVTSEGSEASTTEKPASKVADQDADQALVDRDSEETIALSKVEIDDPITVAQSEEAIATSKDITRDYADVLISVEPSITPADFEDGRIFQRKGKSADITVSGTFTGTPKTIQARVVRDSALEEIVPWTVIDISPRNRIFLGVLPDVPQGGWYNIQVRHGNDHRVTSFGSHKWGVGILVACLGQSNMKEWFYTGTTLRAHPLLRKFTSRGWAELDKTGNAGIAFGNRIIERLGIPVGLLDFSKNGSGLRKEADFGTGYWEDTSVGSIYNRFIAGVSNIGGALEFLVWVQGEADAARGTVTEDEYAKSLESFITNQVRPDIYNGSDREYLPFLVVMMVKRPGGKDKPNQAIRNAQKRVTETVSDCYVAATTLDLKNQGKQHLTPDAYVTMGRRVAQTVLFILGEEEYYRGPEVAEVMRLDDRAIDVRIKHRGGIDFTPDSGISGWEVLANESQIPIAEVYRNDPQTIRIFLKKPLTEKVTIRYLYGAMPDASSPVLDNSPMRLPLEEYQSQIQ